jgi:hypothetical protein
MAKLLRTRSIEIPGSRLEDNFEMIFKETGVCCKNGTCALASHSVAGNGVSVVEVLGPVSTVFIYYYLQY